MDGDILHSNLPIPFKEIWIADEIDKNIIERDIWYVRENELDNFRYRTRLLELWYFDLIHKMN